MNPSDIIEFISKHQSLIVSLLTGSLLGWKFISKNVFHFETKSDRKRNLKADLDIAKYLVSPKIESLLVNQMAFEALTGKKASLETIDWLLNSHDPSTALEIYAHAPGFIRVKDNNIQPLKWIQNFGQRLYYLSLIVSILILLVISLLFFYGTNIFVQIYEANQINHANQLIAYIILIVFFFVDILGLLWIMNQISNSGIFLAKVQKFYKEIELKT